MNQTATAAPDAVEPSAHDMRLVIGASSLGTIFEWYDFFIYGTLGTTGIMASTFFPAGNQQLANLLVWATFAVGFGFRPLGAILFGYLGDKLGRKYTFLVTISLMGLATAGVGLIPSFATIGIAAPLLILALRVLQGLALGGEYGGAAIYVAEHSPHGRSGFHTGFIQASVVGGFILSLAVVLVVMGVIDKAAWLAWGWRIPFLFSLVLLAVSLWMRLKLSESPVFKAIKDAGETAANPFVESFTYPGNWKRLLVALFGIAAGLTVIWYTAMFSVLTFLKTMHVDDTAGQLITGGAALAGLVFFIWFGSLSDRIGRKPPIVWGYLLTLVLLFPCFWVIGNAANPGLAEAARRAPVVVMGPDCSYDPFATKQTAPCAKILEALSKKGVAYSKAEASAVGVTIGGRRVEDTSPDGLGAALGAAGYDLTPAVPPVRNIIEMFAAILVLMALSGATYGPVAALLTEMFPSRIRYSSMSIPYHFGTGYFGGFLPLISQAIIALTGDPYAGLWYTFAVVAMAFVVTLFGLQETRAPAKA